MFNMMLWIVIRMNNIINMHQFWLIIDRNYLPNYRVSNASNIFLSNILFLLIHYIAYILAKNNGNGEDLFLHSLLVTCLNVYIYPNLF
jgi:hypothetical protein